jgi:thiol-disulfide isomerase/thioredoxin
MSLFRKIPAKPLLAAMIMTLSPSLFAQQRTKPADAPAAQSGGESKQDYKSIGSPLPPIRAVYPGKGTYTNKDVQNGANLFVMLFNPTCEHCQDMTIDFHKNLSLFGKSNIIMLASPSMGAYLELFDDATHVNKYPRIRVGLDSADFISKTFLYENLPQVNIYSPEGKLLKTYSGITTIDSLKRFIQ